MNSLSMILRILAIVAAIAAGALFYMSKGKLAEQQVALQKAEQTTQTVKAELATALEQIETKDGQLKTEREALADAKRKIESSRSEMYTARQEVSRAQQQLSESKKSIQELENTAKSLRAELVQAEANLASSNKEAEITQFKTRVAELEKSNAELKESLEDAKARAVATRKPAANATGSIKTGGAYSSTFTPSASAPLPTASIGAETTILSVSSKNGLVILGNNAELGLTPGVEVTLVDGFDALGKIQIVQVNENNAVANILPGTKARAFQEGATVKLLR